MWNDLVMFCVVDPDGKDCNSDCGEINALNVARHVYCRLQCVPPDFTGLLSSDWSLVLPKKRFATTSLCG